MHKLKNFNLQHKWVNICIKYSILSSYQYSDPLFVSCTYCKKKCQNEMTRSSVYLKKVPVYVTVAATIQQTTKRET